jgi:endonuclease/exonuclease/phosphatase family metal-dependent hydrolase
MILLSYNIKDGGGERLPGLLKAIHDLDPDIAVLCELNGWQSNASPLPGYHLSLNTSGNTPYQVGILSREPPTELRFLNRGLHHGALLARFPSLSIVAAHLHPFEEEIRIREAEAILHAMEGVDGPIVIAGDLNSCLSHEAGINGRSGALERFFAGGFEDPGKDHTPNHSLCTALSPKDPRWRFDYILSKKISWSSLQSLHNPVYAELSDHWPVLGCGNVNALS